MAVLLAEPEGLGRTKAGVVEAGEEATQMAATIERTDVGHGGQQFARLKRVDHDATVDDLGNRRRTPADTTEVVGGQFLDFNGVLKGVVEHRTLAANGRRGGRRAVQLDG